MPIVIVDYGMGNLGSILNMFKHIRVEARIASNFHDLDDAEKIVLPGVGAFDYGMRSIHQKGLFSILNHKVLEQKTPLLGICLGMQLITDRSEEGVEKGFGWISGSSSKFFFDKKNDQLKVPHMGWNSLNIEKNNPLLSGLGEDPRFYFIHSYHIECKQPDEVLATTTYGYKFPSVIKKGNIMGAQFHPEKSHKFGIQFLKNFAAL